MELITKIQERIILMNNSQSKMLRKMAEGEANRTIKTQTQIKRRTPNLTISMIMIIAIMEKMVMKTFLITHMTITDIPQIIKIEVNMPKKIN